MLMIMLAGSGRLSTPFVRKASEAAEATIQRTELAPFFSERQAEPRGPPIVPPTRPQPEAMPPCQLAVPSGLAAHGANPRLGRHPALVGVTQSDLVLLSVPLQIIASKERLAGTLPNG